MKNRTQSYILACALLFCAVAGNFHFAMAQFPVPTLPVFDPLIRLKGALADAGAAPLTAQQEQQLRALVLSFQIARQSLLEQGAALQEARRRYDDAILTGDLAAADAQTAIISKRTSDTINSTLQAEARFKIQVLNVLKTNDDQIGFLLKRVGTAGLSGLLNSLANGSFILRGLPVPTFNGNELFEFGPAEKSGK